MKIFSHYIINIFYSFTLSIITLISKAQTTEYNYQQDNADIANPERGLYRYIVAITTSNDQVQWPLRLNDFEALKNANKTLVYRGYYLNRYTESPIAASFLQGMQEDFNTAREKGIKLIIRFAYNYNTGTVDASLDYVLLHISQLKPLLQANADVIACFQAGFIGTWGEWGVTHPDFTNSDGSINYVNRKRVVDSLLSATPKDRMIQIRTPRFKQVMYGDGNTGASVALDPGLAHSEIPIARLGHHNDCFLASFSDYSTYRPDTLNDKRYLAAETKYLVMGGETCAVNSPRSDCSNLGGNADIELERFHWSFLSGDYNVNVLNRWSSPGNCLDEVKKRLGYRFQMISGSFSNNVEVGQTFNLQLRLRNVGFAAPYNARKVIIVLRNTVSNQEYSFLLSNLDPRFWLPYNSPTDEIVINENIRIPPDFQSGSYSVLLHLADPYPSLAANPSYSIRTANLNTWEPLTGYNNLMHQISVVCPSKISLVNPDNNSESGNKTVLANQAIIASNLILGGRVTFSAKNFIELRPNFEVKNGAVFETLFGGCEN